MHESSEASYDSPVVFRPDPDVVNRLLEAAYQHRVDLHLKVELTDLRSGNIQTVLVHWKRGDLDALLYRVRNALSVDPEHDRYEDYFWLFWRGWAGCLNADLLVGLPAVTPDLLNKVQQGVPLRDSDLRRLQSALEWAYANAAAEWGDTDSWQEGTISPGHLTMRKKVGNFIQARMTDLYGSGYENAPLP